MKRATPVETRKCLQAVEAFKQAGIRFIPMPVLDDADNDALAGQMKERLEKIERMCEAP